MTLIKTKSLNFIFKLYNWCYIILYLIFSKIIHIHIIIIHSYLLYSYQIIRLNLIYCRYKTVNIFKKSLSIIRLIKINFIRLTIKLYIGFSAILFFINKKKIIAFVAILIFTYQILDLTLNYCKYETVINIDTKDEYKPLPHFSFCSNFMKDDYNILDLAKILNQSIFPSFDLIYKSNKASLTLFDQICITYRRNIAQNYFNIEYEWNFTKINYSQNKHSTKFI